MRAKTRYMIDNNNYLTIKQNRKNLIPDGKFSIDKNNRLVYWLNEPASWRRQYSLPHKINFIGNWQLTPNYDLELNLDETKDQYKGDRLVLKGEIISTDRDTLVFEIKSYDRGGLLHIQLIKLSGSWQADEYNRIIFLVKKKTLPDMLILQGQWQINKNQQITYNYEKTNLKTKTKTYDMLTFEGFWEINSADRLTYILSRSWKSRFDFRVQLESPNLYPAEGKIKYRIGIGLKKNRGAADKIIALYGAWKFGRKAGISFQMDYGRSGIHAIEFGAAVNLTRKDEAVFNLTNKRNNPLGLSLVFSHRFLKRLDAEAFLRIKKIGLESGFESGVSIPF